MSKNFIRALRFPLAAILAFALVKCGSNKAATPPPAEEPVVVSLQPVTTGSQRRTLQYSGLIASNSEARLSFKIGGIVSRIYVKEGDHVSRGQLLATLDLTEIDAQVQQASQNVEKSKRDEKRISNLYNDTVASLEQLQNSHTQLSLAAEGLRIASFNRQYAQIRAASGGTILQKFLNEGEYASAGTAVFQFNGTEQNDWVVRFGVSDKDWALLKKGDEANVAIDAYPDEQFRGVITKMAEGADPSSSTYPVEVKILPAVGTAGPGGRGDRATATSTAAKLAPGLFCTLTLQPSSGRILTMIPAEALAEGDGKTGYVYTLNTDGRTVTRHKVQVAYLEGALIAVGSGLKNVKDVITSGVGYLTERSVVKVVKKGGAAL